MVVACRLGGWDARGRIPCEMRSNAWGRKFAEVGGWQSQSEGKVEYGYLAHVFIFCSAQDFSNLWGLEFFPFFKHLTSTFLLPFTACVRTLGARREGCFG